MDTANLSASGNNSKRQYKILIVDDEEAIRELFLETLADLSQMDNWEVYGAVDGVDALAKCEAIDFDLVLLDIVMPKKDGIQTLTELVADKQKYGNPRILMITNIGGDLAIDEALKIGAVGYKVKIDVEPHDLITTVKEELDKIPV